MAVKMKALRTFLGRPGEGDGANKDKVRMGREFSVETPARAESLESGGLAARTSKKAEKTPDKPAENKAAKTGPLTSAGGKTGAALTSSSSAAGRAPQKQVSKSSGAKRKS